MAPFSRQESKKGLGGHGPSGAETVVTYFFCGEEIPYRRSMSSHSLTLGHFKEQLRKKGNYRWVQRPPGGEGGGWAPAIWELLQVGESGVRGKPQSEAGTADTSGPQRADRRR